MFSFVHSFLFCVVKNMAEARRVQIWLKGVNLFALKAVERLLCPVMTSNLIVSWKCSIRILYLIGGSAQSRKISIWFYIDFLAISIRSRTEKITFYIFLESTKNLRFRHSWGHFALWWGYIFRFLWLKKIFNFLRHKWNAGPNWSWKC